MRIAIFATTDGIQTKFCKSFKLKSKMSGGLKNYLINLNQICCIIVIMARGVKKGLNTKKFDRCVTKVKRKSGKVNPYAVCNASMSGKTKTKHKKRQCKQVANAGKLVYIFLYFLFSGQQFELFLFRVIKCSLKRQLMVIPTAY